VVKNGKTVDLAVLPQQPILTSAEARNPGEIRVK
jgi:hypothetical protein